MADRGRKRSVTGNALINIFLILMMMTLYFATSEPDAQETLAAVYGAPVYSGNVEDAVAIELCVDWNAAAVEPILDELRSMGVNITFAVSGEWAKENAALLCRITDEGHELATMGMTPSFDGSLSEVEADVRLSAEAIEAIAGVSPAIYYSGGRNIPVSSRASKRLGLTHVLCTLDLMCARGSSEDIVDRALNGAEKGSIMLMQPTRAALEALSPLCAALRDRGMRVTTVSGVIGVG